MFILIGVWGSRQRKIHAVYQLFFYTLFGSLLMLLGILVIYSHVQTTDIRILYNTNFSFYRQLILWASFFLLFVLRFLCFHFIFDCPKLMLKPDCWFGYISRCIVEVRNLRFVEICDTDILRCYLLFPSFGIYTMFVRNTLYVL